MKKEDLITSLLKSKERIAELFMVIITMKQMI